MTTSFQRSRSPTGQESTELGSVPDKAKNLYAAGDVAGAYSAANTAKILLIVTWVLVVIGLLFSGGLWFTGNYPGLGG